MKSFILTLTLLLPFSLSFPPAQASVLEDMCRDCGKGFEACPEEIEKLCESLGNNPGTSPGGPCCRSCYCYWQDGVFHIIPFGDPGLGGPSFGDPGLGGPSFGDPGLGGPSFGDPGLGGPPFRDPGPGGQ